MHFTDWLHALKTARRRSNQKPHFTGAGIERLEDRTLLSVSVTDGGADLLIESDSDADKIFIRKSLLNDNVIVEANGIIVYDGPVEVGDLKDVTVSRDYS